MAARKMFLAQQELPQACFKNVKGFLRCCLDNWPAIYLVAPPYQGGRFQFHESATLTLSKVDTEKPLRYTSIPNTSQSIGIYLHPNLQISLRGSHPDHLPTSRDSSQPSIVAFPNAPPAVGSCWRDGSNNENPSFYLLWFRFVG